MRWHDIAQVRGHRDHPDQPGLTDAGPLGAERQAPTSWPRPTSRSAIMYAVGQPRPVDVNGS
jgi:hypothetical protein